MDIHKRVNSKSMLKIVVNLSNMKICFSMALYPVMANWNPGVMLGHKQLWWGHLFSNSSPYRERAKVLSAIAPLKLCYSFFSIGILLISSFFVRYLYENITGFSTKKKLWIMSWEGPSRLFSKTETN